MLPDEPDAQARFFYLALLGILLAAGLMHGYRLRLSAAVQHATIWGLIFLGLVLAYGFKGHLASQLLPDRAATLDAGSVALRRSSDGHFYARLTVEGVELRFLVDTGASSIVLSREDAGRIGLDLDRLSFVVPASTANGTVMGAPVTLARVELGGITDTGVQALVSGGEMRTSLLGMSYLGRFRRLSVEGDRLVLTR